jgi:hypothetical protein
MKFRYASAVLLFGSWHDEFGTKSVVVKIFGNRNGFTAISVCLAVLAQSGV